MCDFLSLGELLIDFTPSNLSTEDKYLLERNPGGAPANVAVQLSLLGISSGFIGKVGNDAFGRFLKSTLDSFNVSTAGLILDDNFLTTLAFVHLNESGDRSFSFYRKPGADTQLRYQEIDFNLINNCKMLHFGSLSLTDEPLKTTTIRILEYAKSKGKIISYDPNWRPPLWRSKEDGVEGMKLGLKYCDIIKVSDEELVMITGCNDNREGINRLLDMGIQVVLVTLGPNGCYVGNKDRIEHLNTYDVHIVDTTGSGDSFLGSFLYNIISCYKPLNEISYSELIKFADFSNAAGALCASKTGSIPSLPNINEIHNCIKHIPKKKI